jgi:hypothetical protein
MNPPAGEFHVSVSPVTPCTPVDMTVAPWRSASVRLQVPGSHKSNLIHPAMALGGGNIGYDNPHPDAAQAFSRAGERERFLWLPAVRCTVYM